MPKTNSSLLNQDEDVQDYQEEDNPYQLSSDEYRKIYDKYHLFCKSEASDAERKLPTKSIKEDVTQDLLVTLWRCGMRYKMQTFVVKTLELFQAHPELVPAAHSHKVWPALFCWLMRRNLGPLHGFKVGFHDKHLAEAIMDVDLPPEFSSHSAMETARYLKSHVQHPEKYFTQEETKDFFEFVKMAENGERLEPFLVRVEPLINRVSNLFKPDQKAPLVVDENFHSLCMKFIKNGSNKIKDNIMKKDRVFHAPIPINGDDLANKLTDKSSSHRHRDLMLEDQVSRLQSEVLKCGNENVIAVFNYLYKASQNDPKVIRENCKRNKKNMPDAKEISRNIGLSLSEVTSCMKNLAYMVTNLGGIEEILSQSGGINSYGIGNECCLRNFED